MKKILIANRGEIAVRIIRACRELGIKTVAVFSTVDRDALHCRLADESYCIGSPPSKHSYLSIPQLMSVAAISGSDAIHPGYGFLAENHKFARVCEQYQIKFIGPTSEHIEQLGDKLTAKQIAKNEGVPLLNSSHAPLSTYEEAHTAAKKIGYPLIIKAAAGGGGRGMRIVKSAKHLQENFHTAQREAETFFGNSQVFLEKFLTSPRHVEIQVAADDFGNSIHLGERDCTVQRRHQKIIEESPCPTITKKLRTQLGNAALKIVRSVKYLSLGTVEFLLDKDNSFYFIEMNTRIQVEHPITELVTGIDLVKEQIRIACGEKIDVKNPNLQPRGHAIECRINAEDAVTFAPNPGRITDYHLPGGPGIRIDSMLTKDCYVPPDYDSMIAKLIAYGNNRDEALNRMRRALQEMQVNGIKTNINFHLKVIDHPNFRKGNISTNFIDELLSTGS